MLIGRRLFSGVVSMCLATCASTAELKDENLLVNIPAGYKMGYQQRKPQGILLEMVPTAESVQDWTEMVTSQIFLGTQNRSPKAFRETFEQMTAKACSGNESAGTTSGSENGYPFELWINHCPLNPSTQKPEWTMLKAIGGQDSFYVVQKAFRFEPSEDQIRQASMYLRRAMVCDTRGSEHPCPTVQPVEPAPR